MDCRQKSIMTVVGASDQIFESILRGAKKVDGFDISLNSIMLYYLKEAAIKTLTYEEYLNFFFVERISFNSNEYQKIRDNLNAVAVPFWDTIFMQDVKKPIDIIGTIARINGQYTSALAASRKLSQTSSHLNPMGYERLKSLINSCEVNIYFSDVKQLDRIEGIYDYIILSNIFEYQKGQELIEFKKAIERYRSKLTDSGQIIVGYAYHDVDLTPYQEYSQEKIPSRFTAWGYPSAPEDVIISARKR